MRTDHPAPGASSLARLRSRLLRARRALEAQAPLVRWSLGLAAVAGLLLGTYWASSPSPANGVYLFNGQQFASDDVIAIKRELNAKHVPHAVIDRKVEVAADRLVEAEDAITKRGVGSRSVTDVRNPARASGFFEGPTEKERRESQRRNEELEAYIRKLPGVLNAFVSVKRTKVRGLRPDPVVTAFVWVETERGGGLGYKTLQSVQNILIGNEPELKPEALTVMDQTGTNYLDATNPTVGARTKTRAREEDGGEKIVKELEHIKGVRVTVRLPTPVPPHPSPPVPPPPAEELAPPILANRPLELEPEASSRPVSLPEPPKPAAEPEPARVWVKVPSSFYLRLRPNREPSSDELRQVRERTENQIKTAVELALPRAEFGVPTVTIDTIPDPFDAAPPPLPSAPPEVRRVPSWWIAVGAAGGAGAAALFVGFRVLAARRPSGRPTPPDFGRFTAGAASEPRPGPSERVRELIRLDPEAAAGVLQRWTGQGGHDQ